VLCLVAASLAAGCGSGKVSVPKDQTDAHRGAVLFNQRCSGCHSIDQANAYGSKPKKKLQATERTDGPNFNVRKVKHEDVLFAIRNGGFSGAIMPANVVVGKDAQYVADFLAKYSGRQSSSK
jgi:mono/diheme cytochrome c family protein